jgi:hypothetical protein
MSVHGDNPELELVALGIAQPAERRRVLAHIATCSSCAQLLRAHERTVALLAAVYGPPKRARPRRISRAAVALVALAAACVIAFVPWRVSVFGGVDAASPPATVVYDSRGRWMYVLIASTRVRCHIDGVTHGRRFAVGVPVLRGAVAWLMTDSPGRFDSLELRDDSHVLAVANISMR